MQDLAPLEELERQRAEFLQMVSHELRVPLLSIKGATATALGTAPRFESGGDAGVFPNHRSTGRPHARAHQ